MIVESVTIGEQTEHFHFNLTEAELTKMQMRHPGGMSAYLQGVIDSGDGGQIIEAFEMLLRASYGRRENNRFVKRADWFDEITASDHYSYLFMKLVTDAEYGAKFVNGIMPADLMQRAEAAAAKERSLKGLAPSLVELDEFHGIKSDVADVPVATHDVQQDEGPGLSLNLQRHLAGLPDHPEDKIPSNKEAKKLTKAELLQAYRNKNNLQLMPIYSGMSIEQAMELPPEDFGRWLAEQE